MAGIFRKLMVLAALGLTASGCAGPKGETLADFPTLASLQPRVPPHYAIPEDAKLPRPTAMIVIQSVEVPLTANLSQVWKLVNEDAFDHRTLDAWHANGLRVGIVSTGKLKQISKALPRLLRNNRVRQTGSADPMALYKGAVIEHPMSVFVPDVRGNGFKRETVDRGRAQLLETVTQEGRGSFYLELTPHVYWPKLTIKPQSQLKRQLDGTIYHSLTLGADLSPNAVLVVGLYQPPTESFEKWQKAFLKRQGQTDESGDKGSKQSPTKDAKNKPDASGPHANWPEDRKALPYVPRHFGRAIMVDPTFGGNRQTLLFIGVHAFGPTQTRQAANGSAAAAMGGD